MLQKLKEKNVRGVSRYLHSLSEEQSDLGTFMVPSPEGDSEAGVGVAILFVEILNEGCVCY